MNSNLIFVYGSLMRDQENRKQLDEARYLGETLTAPGYRLLNCGAYPAMTRGGNESVFGEAYMVHDKLLKALDEFEEVPSLYQRTTIMLMDGREAQAWLLPEDADTDWPIVASGDWRKRS